jgi:hypothetical protein
MTRATILATLASTALVVAACNGDIGTNGAGKGSGGSGAKSSSSAGGNGFGANGAGNDDSCNDCIDVAAGVGTDNPFDVDENPSDGVGTDDDGALVLDASNANIPGIIWIANTSLDTVTKVDTTTYAILGRYRTDADDPSRTSVNSAGDVFVGNRAGNALTKILGAGDDCPDTNGDGSITTSTGFGDVLGYVEEDCSVWTVPVPDAPRVRGVAAQDLIVPDPLPDWPDHTKVEHYVWVGGTNHRTIYKYDGDDGTLLIQSEAPTSVYGLALDGNGNIWMAGRGDGNSLGRVDTTQCVDQASCDAAPICVRDCTSGACTCDPSCGIPCDQAAKERILLPDNPYGITVDFNQRVWLGGTRIMRYDPSQPDAMRYADITGQPFVHGIAADAEGFVWGAARASGVIRIDGDTLATQAIPGVDSKGIAVDKDGKIWGIEYGANAHVITPGPTLPDYAATPAAVTGLGQCYTYSDMTGLQLALAANDPGYYRETAEGCPEGTEWVDLEFDVETPPGTQVRFAARSADSVAALGMAQWVPLAKVPPDTSPFDIASALQSASVAMGRYLEWEVTLYGAPDPNGGGILSPRVLSVGVSYHCPPVAQ